MDPTEIDYDEAEMREEDLDGNLPGRDEWLEKRNEDHDVGWDGDEHIHEPEGESEQDEYAFSQYEA